MSSPSPDALLHAALRAAQRRLRMPPLPATAADAQALGPEAALAWATEAARAGQAPVGDLASLFTASLAALIRQALAPEGGDPAFQALVLRAHEPAVAEYVRLGVQASADRRLLRASLDAAAHPGKWRGAPPGPLHAQLAHWHALTQRDDWSALAASLAAWLAGDAGEPALRAALTPLSASASLQRLARAEALRTCPVVQRYLALCAQRGPLAGSRAAAAEGRASARRGDAAEQQAFDALAHAAARLQRRAPAGWRALRGLRTPPGFPGEAGKAKDEWDVALVREADSADALDLVLLVEVKVSPAAATPDFARLQRGLQRLAQADPHRVYAFGSTDGSVRLTGASLGRLQPQHRRLPEGAVYCCAAPSEPQPPWLSAASKAVLLAEPECLEFARQVAQGLAPAPDALARVWQSLLTAPRLRTALHQYDTARAARDAMLHPDDLLDAVARV